MADVRIAGGRIVAGTAAPERRGILANVGRFVLDHGRGWPANARGVPHHRGAPRPPRGDAAHRTSLPASMMGLRGRGTLEEGAHADVVIFDEAAIRDRATVGEPRRKASIDTVLVNGRIVYREDELTGTLPGRSLRRGEG